MIDCDRPLKVIYEDDHSLVEVDDCTIEYIRKLSHL